jgi:hypothetical protein
MNIELVREIDSVREELESLRGLMSHGRNTGQAGGQWMENLEREEIALVRLLDELNKEQV